MNSTLRPMPGKTTFLRKMNSVTQHERGLGFSINSIFWWKGKCYMLSMDGQCSKKKMKQKVLNMDPCKTKCTLDGLQGWVVLTILMGNVFL